MEPRTLSAFRKTLAIPEILDQVFAQALTAHDVATLKVCSLVCRAWDTLSARHLFATIRFDASLLIPSLADPDVDRPVHTWLVDKPRVLHNVREVIVMSDIAFTMSISSKSTKHISLRLIEDIHASFPHLTIIRFAGLPIFGPTEDASSLATYAHRIPSSPSLDTLELSVWQTGFQNASVASVIGAFGDVGTLILHSMRQSFLIRSHDRITSRRSKIKALVLRNFKDSSMDHMFCILAHCIDFTDLATFSVVDHLPGRATAYVNEFIHEHAQQIREFALTTGEIISAELCVAKSHPGSCSHQPTSIT